MSQTAALIVRLQALGLSQLEIARRTGIPQPRLSRWKSASEPTITDDVLKLVELERAELERRAEGASTPKFTCAAAPLNQEARDAA